MADRQQLIDMVQGNGTYTEEVQQPDGTTIYKLHRRHGDYHEILNIRDKATLQALQIIAASDL